MPVYEYECSKCGHHTEALQKFSDPPLTECEMCHGKMKKLISHSAFHLKGSGWYVTDYASKKGCNQVSSTGPEKNASGPESSKSSDTSKKSDSPAKSSKDSPAKKGSKDK